MEARPSRGVSEPQRTGARRADAESEAEQRGHSPLHLPGRAEVTAAAATDAEETNPLHFLY